MLADLSGASFSDYSEWHQPASIVGWDKLLWGGGGGAQASVRCYVNVTCAMYVLSNSTFFWLSLTCLN